jgi:hypothetical protein
MKNTVVSTARAPVYLEGEAEPRGTLTERLVISQLVAAIYRLARGVSI